MADIRQHRNDNRSNNKGGKPPGPYSAGKQDHFLAEMKQQYGEDFVGIADVNQEFSKRNKMLALIRSIFNGRVDLNTYGVYLAYPQIRDRLLQLSQSNLIEAFAHSSAMQYMMWNQQVVANLGIPSTDIIQIANRDGDLQRLWQIIFEGFNSIALMGGNLTGLVNSINSLRTQYCSDGRTLLVKLI